MIGEQNGEDIFPSFLVVMNSIEADLFGVEFDPGRIRVHLHRRRTFRQHRFVNLGKQGEGTTSYTTLQVQRSRNDSYLLTISLFLS